MNKTFLYKIGKLLNSKIIFIILILIGIGMYYTQKYLNNITANFYIELNKKQFCKKGCPNTAPNYTIIENLLEGLAAARREDGLTVYQIGYEDTSGSIFLLLKSSEVDDAYKYLCSLLTQKDMFCILSLRVKRKGYDSMDQYDWSEDSSTDSVKPRKAFVLEWLKHKYKTIEEERAHQVMSRTNNIKNNDEYESTIRLSVCN